MTRVYLQPGLRGLSGGMGDWVYQRRKGKTLVGMKPEPSSKEPTEAQTAHRKRFGEAARYARRSLANPAKREFYQMVALEKDISAFATAVMDYMSNPSFEALDFSEYLGHVGERIQITAVQDIGLASVDVELLSDDGTLLESGSAFEEAVRSGLRVYMGQTNLLAGTSITVRLSGADHNGKKAEITETVVVGEQA